MQKKIFFMVFSFIASLLFFQNCGDKLKSNSTVTQTSVSIEPDNSQPINCKTNEHLENGLCNPNSKACVIPNGAGLRDWNGSAYSPCQISQCNSGYKNVLSSCVVVKNYLKTAGNQIVDAAGVPVRLTSVNVHGMETVDLAPIGLYSRKWQDYMNEIKAAGFNSIRLAFSVEMISTTKAPSNISFSANPDLVGKTPLQIMDKLVEYAEFLGLRVILDCHRVTAGNGTETGGLWFYAGNAAYTEAKWIAAWTTLANRYKGNPTVIGADLFNEPHNPAIWGGNSANDFARAVTAAGNAILAINPDWLIFVEGVSGYTNLGGGIPNSPGAWWGQNLQGVATRPIVLNVANRLVYSPHVYPPGVLGETPALLFGAATFPANMPPIWDKMFGYIYKNNTAPLWFGEFAANETGIASNAKCTLNDPREPKWLSLFLKYINGDFDGNGTSEVATGKLAPSWAYWSWAFDDCGRFMYTDVRFMNRSAVKINLLKPLIYKQF
jgi:aryl-phospho-beta-D-glucosidase BglC (GH1 family)